MPSSPESDESVSGGDKNRISEQEMNLLRRAAENGHVEAQWQLGLMYADGDAIKLDYVQAAAWIKRAAEQGFVRAQSVMGWLFANGLGVHQNSQEAGRWYLTAAEQGSAKDQYMVATMYRFGRYGVEKDRTEMLRWYQAAADQGFAPAQYALGKMLVEGHLVPKDLILAFQWLSLAGVNGSTAAGKHLQQLMRRMSPEQVEEAKARMLAPSTPASGVGN